jgi:hypothetical protein
LPVVVTMAVAVPTVAHNSNEEEDVSNAIIDSMTR